jgi:molecular chaperone GrpE
MGADRDKRKGSRRREGSGEGASSRPSGSLPETPSPSPVSDPSRSPVASSPEPADGFPSSPAPQQEEEEKVRKDLSDLLSDVERERDEYLALAQRTKADFENYRKRVAREATEAELRGRSELAKALVPVLDNLERALAAAENRPDRPEADDPVAGGTASLAAGVRLVYEELAGVLRGAGIESYEPTGERFDPDWHEAMMTRPGEAGQVLEVLEKGYRLNGNVLRPARVVVGAEE